MLISMLLIAAGLAQADISLVPGLCSAPVRDDRDTPGCYQTGEIDLPDSADELYWHIQEYETQAEAAAEASRHRWASVAQARSRVWLYVLGKADEKAAA